MYPKEEFIKDMQKRYPNASEDAIKMASLICTRKNVLGVGTYLQMYCRVIIHDRRLRDIEYVRKVWNAIDDSFEDFCIPTKCEIDAVSHHLKRFMRGIRTNTNRIR